MAVEILHTEGLSKEQKYRAMLEQALLIISGESDQTANLANVASLLKNTFDSFIWAGFYITSKNDNAELVLGPFQGRPACTRIRFGKGVCGTAASEKRTVIVEDVDKFPGHIVCDSLSRSEIVVPLISKGITVAVIDIDSDRLSNFDETDKLYLEELAGELVKLFEA